MGANASLPLTPMPMSVGMACCDLNVPTNGMHTCGMVVVVMVLVLVLPKVVVVLYVLVVYNALLSGRCSWL